MEPIITTEQIYDYIEQGVKQLWSSVESAIMPIIYENIENAIVVAIVSFALFKVWQFIHIEASPREEKRVRRNMKDNVGAVLSIFDLFKKGK